MPLPEYIGSASCTECHRDQAEDWKDSHHALAWTLPGPDTVLGDFDDARFDHNRLLSRFRRENDQYMIDTDGPDGVTQSYPVAGVAGIAPLQQYLLETEPGRLQSSDLVWDTEKRRWYHLYPDQDLAAGDGLHWTGPYKTWNARCAECHATGYDKSYDAATDSYDSTQAEIGVGCEACHGPGQAHRDWALANGDYDPERWAGLSGTGLTMDFKAGAEAQIQQCAACHARREAFLDGNPVPGTPFQDAYRLSPLRAGLYHADGQIQDEVYVYGSFLQSKMYSKGVACTDCHNPHSGERVASGNAVCTQCHSSAGNTRFPTLPLAEFDDTAHHFHPPDSPGAQCKNCHMVERTYMGIDQRADHSFRVPRPDLSLETGAPNACTDCHDDRTAAWAAETVANWYPDSRHRGPHFSQVFAPARNNPAAQAEGLLEIAEHDGLPAIVRASALDLLIPVATPAIALRSTPLLADPDPLVRASAVPLQRPVPTEAAANLLPLLRDPMRNVRIAAAREFLGLRIAHMPDDATKALGRAMTEWQQSLYNKADFPETQLVMGGIGLTTRNMPAALSAFGEAVEMDPQLVPAWTMIARIHSALGNRQAALDTLDRAIAVNPDDISLPLLRADLQP
ncbi:hypothetical protein I5535_03600 [Rhodobacteraceae bacterium F11138]|nr:hypothetical protein [Rhodobacteraceae bacterium F11138]